MFKLKSKLMLDSFVHSNKNKSTRKLILTVALSIILSLFLAVIIATATGINPGNLLYGLFVNATYEPKTLVLNISIFIIAGLAFIFAYKVGIFNIGITGQMMMAGFTCLAISVAIGNNMPVGISQIFMLLIAMVAAMAVGMIVISLKIYLKVNEVISSILINWIIFFVVRLIIMESNTLNPNPGQETTQSVLFPENFTLAIAGTRHWYSGGWIPVTIITVILVTAVTVTLRYTVFGKKVISVGSSFTASKYLGMNTKAILFSSMAISSAIAGILGYVLYASKSSPAIPVSISVDVLPVEGMNGVAVGLISLCNPVATIPVGFVLGWVQTSSSLLASIPSTIADLINGFVILGAALFTLFLRFKPWIWLNQWIVCRNYPKNYQKFINEFDNLSSKYFSLSSELSELLKVQKYENKIESNKQKIELLKQLMAQTLDENQRSKLDKKIIKLLTNIAKLDKKINDINEIVNTWTLSISADEIRILAKENPKSLINLIYSKYLFELAQIKAQFKKHNLVDKTSQTFWSEFEKQKNKDLTIDSIHLSHIKAIKKVEDKIYYIDVLMKQKLEQKIQIIQDSLEITKHNYESKINKLNDLLNVYTSLNDTFKIEQTQQKITLLKEKQEQHLVNKQEQINAKIENLKIKFDQNFENKQELIPIYQEEIQKLNLHYKELEINFINEYDAKVTNKVVSAEKLEKIYEKSMKQADKINLDSEQKELLKKWINDSYEHAINKNKGAA